MRISDWSSDVCSSDLREPWSLQAHVRSRSTRREGLSRVGRRRGSRTKDNGPLRGATRGRRQSDRRPGDARLCVLGWPPWPANARLGGAPSERRSEEHTSELQALMRISYAVFCL